MENKNAEDILRSINTDKLFKKAKDGIEVNMIFLKIRNDDNDSYAIKKKNGDIINISKENVNDKKILDPIMNKLSTSDWGATSKLCTYDISTGFLKEKYKESEISIILFSNRDRSSNYNRKLRKIDDNINLVLCGLLFISKKKDYLYINAVCAKSGFGTPLIELTIDLTKIYNMKKIKLTSIDKPIGFYLAKKFEFDKGQNTYELGDYPLFIKGNNSSSNRQLKKHGAEEKKMGMLYSPKNKVNFLKGIKVNDDGAKMTLTLQYKTKKMSAKNSQKPKKMSAKNSQKTKKMSAKNSRKTKKMSAKNSRKTKKMSAKNSQKTKKMSAKNSRKL